jgi:HTH-type transcriptional regulator/antitoxin HigA
LSRWNTTSKPSTSARPIRPLRSEADYESALAEIDHCLEAQAGSAEQERLDVLTILVDDYEASHPAIGPPDLIAAIQFALEQRGLTRLDLEGLIGSSGRVSEVLNRQRRLTLPMIRWRHAPAITELLLLHAGEEFDELGQGDAVPKVRGGRRSRNADIAKHPGTAQS